MKEIKLNIITPDKKFFTGKITKIRVMGETGSMTILPNHTALITLLVPHIATFTTVEGKEYSVFISQGLLSFGDNSMDILCESAENPEDINVERAKKSKERAEERLHNRTKHDSLDVRRAEISLQRAICRMKLYEIR